jgi:hypothetical protein
MESSSNHQSPSESGPPPSSIQRLSIGSNVVLQTVLFTAIVLMVNFFSFRHFIRWDFSRSQKYALAPMTKNLLGNLKKPVKAILFFPSAAVISQDVAALLREYEYASERKFSVELVDPYRNLLRAKELSEKYKFGNNDNIVILDVDGRSKFVNASEMVEMDSTGTAIGQRSAVRAFKGEEALTSALLELTEEKQNKMYFLSGHGETAPKAEELSSIKSYIDRQNIKLEVLNLNDTDAIPQDASGLVVFGPRKDFSDRDVKLLSDYWNDRNGRLLVLLHGNTKTPRLAEWLASIGITLHQDVAVKSGTMLAIESGQPVLRPGIITNAVGFTDPKAKGILKEVAGLDMQLTGLSQSLGLEESRANQAKVRAIPLLITTADYWGETDFLFNNPQSASEDPKSDHQGPLTLGFAAERGALQDPRVKLETSRMVVLGNAAFLSNEGLQVSDLGVDFAIHTLNWLMSREQLAGIPPKPKQALSLSLNEVQLKRISLVVIGIIPTTFALIGLLVWWRRRA